MRILVIGASGLVGAHVLAQAMVDKHDVVGTFRTNRLPGMIKLDLADRVAMELLLDEFKPDWVVHAGGWTWVDGCERDAARAMEENCTQPADLARACRRRGIRMLYYSTTYVFDGQEGPYDEDSRPNPINVYGQSKLDGESSVLSILGSHALVPRIICVWGDEARRKNFTYQVVDAIKKGASMSIPSDQLGNPSWAGDIAGWSLQLMQTQASGLWNLCGAEMEMTRVDWVRAIVAGARQCPSLAALAEAWHFEAIPTGQLKQIARRPLDASASIKKIMARFPRVTRPPGAIAEVLLGSEGSL